MEKNQPKSEVKLMLELTNEFQDESDRAAAVLAAAYLDHLLGELIAATMTAEPEEVEELLFQKGNGPLGTFSACINTAYCLGLLSGDEWRDLHLIRKIRNDFAHELTGMSFEGTQTIANRCRELKSAKIGGRPKSLRESFSKASVRLMVDIILRIQEKLSHRDQA
jgi:DNA-binding MltR family transcriptional regulator